MHAAVCDVVEPWRWGTRIAAARFPRYWDVNLLRVEGAPADLSAQALAAEADRLQAGLEHRKVEVEDEATGAALRPGFERLGWTTDRLAVMHHDGRELPSSPRACEAPAEATRLLRREWLAEEGIPDDFDGAGADALKPGTLSHLVALDAAGDPAAYLTLRLEAQDGEIEDLYCTPDQRGRGLATALVGTAVARARAAGIVHLWIVADDEDWPGELYARLGFGSVWRHHDMVRRPGQPDAR